MSYFGKFYISGPQAQQAADWVFTGILPMVHLQNVQLLNVQVKNVQLQNVQLQNVQLLIVQLQNVQLQYFQLQGVQLQDVQITKRPDYQTSSLPNVQFTKRPVYQTSRLPNVQITKHKSSLYISINLQQRYTQIAKRKKHRYALYHKVLTYVEYRAVSGVFQNIDPPPPSPPSECVLPPAPKAGGTPSLGPVREVGGSIFWKTPDIGLASYSIISLCAILTKLDKLCQQGCH
jgi:hypothetical protein